MHRLKYYSTVKRKELRQYITTWIDLKIIMLSERKQEYLIPFIENYRKYKLNHQLSGCLGNENGKGQEEVSARSTRKVLEVMGMLIILTVVVVTWLNTYDET